nr:MAG TPA: hypothetical protein [Caudoviricetes sp.]
MVSPAIAKTYVFNYIRLFYSLCRNLSIRFFNYIVI